MEREIKMFTEYGPLSTKVYDFTKPIGKSIDGDLEYYFKKIQSFEKGKVLEAGVGTGRMAIPFLKEGIDLIGIDLSADMLKKCEENYTLHGVEGLLYQQNLLSLNLPHTFSTIIMPTGSFNLLPGRKGALQVLKNFYHHLLPKGHVVIDIELPTNFTPGDEQKSFFQISNNETILLTTTSLERNWQEQKTLSLNRYEQWREGSLIQTELGQFVLYWYGLEEFKDLLLQAGFTNITKTFDYAREDTYQNIATFIAEK